MRSGVLTASEPDALLLLPTWDQSPRPSLLLCLKLVSGGAPCQIVFNCQGHRSGRGGGGCWLLESAGGGAEVTEGAPACTGLVIPGNAVDTPTEKFSGFNKIGYFSQR